MRVFVDTNVFIASLTDEPERGEEATAFLNEPTEFVTSIRNLVELRTVLAKKKNVERERVESIIVDIRNTIAICQPDEEDLLGAYDRQLETLLYPLDCVFPLDGRVRRSVSGELRWGTARQRSYRTRRCD